VDTRISLAEARVILAEQVASGLSVRDFCGRRGWRVGRLYGLRRRVRLGEVGSVGVSFHEIMPPVVGDGGVLLRVIFADGVRLEVLSGSVVRGLVAELRGGLC
jgi:hypothetical protein